MKESPQNLEHFILNLTLISKYILSVNVKLQLIYLFTKQIPMNIFNKPNTYSMFLIILFIQLWHYDFSHSVRILPSMIIETKYTLNLLKIVQFSQMSIKTLSLSLLPVHNAPFRDKPVSRGLLALVFPPYVLIRAYMWPGVALRFP